MLSTLFVLLFFATAKVVDVVVDLCEEPEPPAPENPEARFFRIKGGRNAFVTVTLSNKIDKRVILCNERYTWRQAFVHNGLRFQSPYDQKVALTKLDYKEGCGLAMRSITQYCDQDMYSGENSIGPTKLKDQHNLLLSSLSCDDINWQTEPFLPRFYIQNIKSKLVLTIDEELQPNEKFLRLHMTKLDNESTLQQWEHHHTGHLRSVGNGMFLTNNLKQEGDVKQIALTAPGKSIRYKFIKDYVSQRTNSNLVLTGPSNEKAYYSKPDGSCKQKFKKLFLPLDLNYKH